MIRQERIGRTLMPEERLLCHFRSEPRSVYYKWLGSVCEGRECIWVQTKNSGKILSIGGKSDFGLTGLRMAVAPDGFLARSRSRYQITESGQDQLAKNLLESVRDPAKADRFEYRGFETPSGVSQSWHHLRERIPKGDRPQFPDGGTRDWYFDPDSGRTMLIEGRDPSGERLEYYYFEHLFPNPALNDSDFDPEQVWEKPTKEKATK